jgi:holo-[acyl-carrier protein] synthase
MHSWETGSVEAIMLGLGVDIICISRVEDAVETTGKVFLDKVFTAWEQQRAESHEKPMAYLAMTFAAKEAIFKTFGIGWQSGVKWTEIEIRDGKFGEPIPVLSGTFAQLAEQRGVSKVLLSLSYDGENAIAVASLVSEKSH